jgi:hypothetical protein
MGAQVGFLVDEFPQAEAREPLHHNPNGAIRRAEQAVDDGRGAHRVEIGRAGRGILGVFRGHQANDAFAHRRVVDELDRARLAHRERHHGLRVDHQPAQRQDRQHLRYSGGAVFLARRLLLFGRCVLDFGDDRRERYLVPQARGRIGYEIHQLIQVFGPACRGHKARWLSSVESSLGWMRVPTR